MTDPSASRRAQTSGVAPGLGVVTPMPRAPKPTTNNDQEWMPFPGGELLGERPRVACATCRSQAQGVANRTICFQCYRAHREHRRRLLAALETISASEAAFQATQPFEPVDRERLERLRLAREAAQSTGGAGLSRFDPRRRRAQIAARHALDAADVARSAPQLRRDGTSDSARVVRAVVVPGGVELPVPMAWLPFLMSR